MIELFKRINICEKLKDLTEVKLTLSWQELRRLFNIEGAQIFQKGATSRPFEAT